MSNSKGKPRGLYDGPDWAKRARKRAIPIFKAEIERLRGAFEAGDTTALLIAIERCAQITIPMPNWVADAYYAAYLKLFSYEARTMDEAFRWRWKKGYHTAKRKRFNFLYPVFFAVENLIGKGVPVELAFKRVATKFRFSKTIVSNYYYEVLWARRRNIYQMPRVSEFQ